MKMRATILAVTAALAALTLTIMSSPAQADTSKHGKLWDSCHDTRLVLHRGVVNEANPGVGPDEDTIRAFQRALTVAAQHPNFPVREFETDVQPTRDGTIINLHDRTLNRTTNRSGVVSQRNWSAIRHARTADGSRVPTLWNMIQFMIQHPQSEVQLEGKVYGSNWSDADIKRMAQSIVKHDLLARVHFASASLSWLKRVSHALHAIKQASPNRYQWIGFFDRQPVLGTAKSSGLSLQMNVTYTAAFSHYGQTGRSYISAARQQGFVVSTRSHPNGSGDNGTIWQRELSAHAVQIVTNEPERYYGWCNGRG